MGDAGRAGITFMQAATRTPPPGGEGFPRLCRRGREPRRFFPSPLRGEGAPAGADEGGAAAPTPAPPRSPGLPSSVSASRIHLLPRGAKGGAPRRSRDAAVEPPSPLGGEGPAGDEGASRGAALIRHGFAVPPSPLRGEGVPSPFLSRDAPHAPDFMIRALSRFQSRVFSVSRLSCSFLPLPRPSSTLARPRSLK